DFHVTGVQTCALPIYYKSKQLASRYIKVTKIKVHHWITASFYHLRVSVDAWQDTTDEIIGKLGFIGVELTFFTIRSFDHECKHIRVGKVAKRMHVINGNRKSVV